MKGRKNQKTYKLRTEILPEHLENIYKPKKIISVKTILF